MAEAAPTAAAASEEGDSVLEVFLPQTYVLRRRHVEAALKGVPDEASNMTVWIHSSTLGIEEKCFDGMKRVARILVWGQEQHGVRAAVLAAFIAKLRAYEPALVDLIREVATHMGSDDDLHRVGDHAFRDCKELKDVVLPQCISYVGQAAFKECTSLTSVTLPDSLTHLGSAAFFGCISLTSVILPDSLTHVGYSAFWGCASLTSVTLPNSLTHLGEYAFCMCTSLTSVTPPNSLTHVGENAFNQCTSLTSVTLPNSLTHVGEYAFYGCFKLAPVRPFVGGRAFMGCPWSE
jgi:hypothetical protein